VRSKIRPVSYWIIKKNLTALAIDGDISVDKRPTARRPELGNKLSQAEKNRARYV
jgi:hypothetical protein